MFLQFISKQLLFPSFVCFSLYLSSPPRKADGSQPWQGLPWWKPWRRPRGRPPGRAAPVTAKWGSLQHIMANPPGKRGPKGSAPEADNPTHLQLFPKWPGKTMDKGLRGGWVASRPLYGGRRHAVPRGHAGGVAFTSLLVLQWALRIKISRDIPCLSSRWRACTCLPVAAVSPPPPRCSLMCRDLSHTHI